MNNMKQIFYPGSECLYFKLYLEPICADNILIDLISNFINKLQEQTLLKKWFFIRYSDTDFHIRFRIFVNDKNNIGKIINLFYSEFSNNGNNSRVWNIQIDTYKREIDRYGSLFIEDSESLFCNDSECIIPIIELVKEERNEDIRWMIALKLIDSTLSDFSYTLEKKSAFLSIISEAFKAEFNLLDSRNTFKDKYREHKESITKLFSAEHNNSVFDQAFKLINIKSSKDVSYIENINTNIKKNNINKERILNDLLSSHIHMMMNRLFQTNNRAHELVVYDLLDRYYIGKIARNKYDKTQESSY